MIWMLLYLIDWAQLWKGMSPCTSPGVGDCVVWWEAWAAVGALLGVAATLFLGVFTLALGRAANRAASLAVIIADAELNRQKLRDTKEGLLVLVQIAGELAVTMNKVRGIMERLEDRGVRENIVAQGRSLRWLRQELEGIAFPVVRGAIDRLHYLDLAHAGRLLRAMATLETCKEFNASEEAATEPDFWLLNLEHGLRKIMEDLGAVWTASQSATRELGIQEHGIAPSVAEQARP